MPPPPSARRLPLPPLPRSPLPRPSAPERRSMRRCPARSPDVKVQAGQSVKRGQVLVILEAMKMENEIQAPCDGKITGVNVRKGDSVETAALLCTIA